MAFSTRLAGTYSLTVCMAWGMARLGGDTALLARSAPRCRQPSRHDSRPQARACPRVPTALHALPAGHCLDQHSSARRAGLPRCRVPRGADQLLRQALADMPPQRLVSRGKAPGCSTVLHCCSGRSSVGVMLVRALRHAILAVHVEPAPVLVQFVVIWREPSAQPLRWPMATAMAQEAPAVCASLWTGPVEFIELA